jgi:ABC-type transport system involved in cytochrome c biogenesis permease subunit
MFSNHLAKKWDGFKWCYAVFLATAWLAMAAGVIVQGMQRGEPTSEIAGMVFMLGAFGVKMAVFAEVGMYVASPIGEGR